MGFEEAKNLVIPIKNSAQIQAYRKALLGILGKIEVGNCDPALKEHIKIVYELLDHLKPDILTETSKVTHHDPL